MFRILLTAIAATTVLSMPVEGKRIRLFTPMEKFTRADMVVVGKVSAIEKDTVDATPFPDVKEKQTYKVAVVKVESGLVGAANITHVKVAFVPPPPANPAAPPVRPVRGFGQVHLTEGQEGLFYLTKHHSGEFYTISPMLTPIDAKDEGYKTQVADAKKSAAVLTDPMKALKAEKADERSFAAIVLVNKYRSYPEGSGKVETAKVAADESKLVLKALTEANWKAENEGNAYQAFSLLALNEKDGWKYPVVKPGEDFVEKTKEAFVKWLEGPGKDYQINKWVRK